jgi:hypothetical protein
MTETRDFYLPIRAVADDGASAPERKHTWNDEDPAFQRARARAAAIFLEHGVAAEAEQLLAEGNDKVEIVAAAVFAVAARAYTETGSVIAEDQLPLLLAIAFEDLEVAINDAGSVVDLEIDDVLPALHRLVVDKQPGASTHAHCRQTSAMVGDSSNICS